MSMECSNPVIRESLKDNLLQISVEMPDSSVSYQYAFYLIKETQDGTSKETIWYQPEPNASFELMESGVYHTVCFIRELGSQGSRLLESKQFFQYIASAEHIGTQQKNRVVPISIFGSCVTRDVLEYQKQGERFLSLESYVSRQSVVSAISPPVSGLEHKVVLDSAFQRRMVLSDLCKDAFQQFNQDKSQYIVVDFIDERFDLIRIGTSYVTASNEAILSGAFDPIDQRTSGLWRNVFNKCESNVLVKKRIGWGGKFFADRKPLECYVKQFATQLKQRYAESHIIIHEAVMQNCYIDRTGKVQRFSGNYIKANGETNRMLRYLYGCLKKYLPNAHVINIDNGFIAYENHKWGLAPMHYQPEYYDRVLSEISKIINQQEDQTEV